VIALASEGITSVNSFVWQSQLRLTWDAGEGLKARHSNVTLKYGYEYEV
jgi:hypothetical protein